jgi:hypothetical protein
VRLSLKEGFPALPHLVLPSATDWKSLITSSPQGVGKSRDRIVGEVDVRKFRRRLSTDRPKTFQNTESGVGDDDDDVAVVHLENRPDENWAGQWRSHQRHKPSLMIPACIIKLITAVIYSFRNKLACLSLNTWLGWKGLPGTNTVAYYGNRKLRP